MVLVRLETSSGHATNGSTMYMTVMVLMTAGVVFTALSRQFERRPFVGIIMQ